MTSVARLLTIGFVSGGSIKPVSDDGPGVNGHTSADKVNKTTTKITAADKVNFLFLTLLSYTFSFRTLLIWYTFLSNRYMLQRYMQILRNLRNF